MLRAVLVMVWVRVAFAVVSMLACGALPAAAQVGAYVAVTPPGGVPVHLHVVEQGRGPPIVLLHGMGGSTYSFRHLIGPLSRMHRVVAIDLKGFGASEKPLDAAYGPRDQALLIAEVLRRRNLTNVTLVGHSFGGAVAMLVALDLRRTEPGRIRRLILMNVPAYPQPISMAQRLVGLPLIGHLSLAVVPPIITTRASLDATVRSSPPPTDDDAIAYATPLHDVGGRHALVTTARAIAETDGRDIIPLYPTLRLPTLIVWCRHDTTVPLSSGERLASELPQARLVVLEPCAHKPAEEAPTETLAAMRSFLARR
jgi:pimeloyl-ACP methyl ester carboxylesterase